MPELFATDRTGNHGLLVMGHLLVLSQVSLLAVALVACGTFEWLVVKVLGAKTKETFLSDENKAI